VSAALSAVVLTVAVVAAARVPAFVVGAMRRDGLIVPIATWDGRRWHADWPRPEKNPDVPISLASVPHGWWGRATPSATWQAWTGGPPRSVHVEQPDWFDAQCLKQIGLRTDYRPATPPPAPSVQPYPKDGLALSTDEPVDPVEILPPAPATPPMIEAFEHAETRLVRRIWPPPAGVSIDPRIRARVPPTVEALYTVADGTERYYYAEMIRRYDKTSAGAECSAVAFGAGWFDRRAGGALHPLGLDVSMSQCDRYGLAYMLPLGVVRLDGRVFWIAQWSGWDYERYGIVELTPGKAQPVLSAYGGGC
jgi:hypothetical protein